MTKASVDAFYAGVEAQIISEQTTYKNANGKYNQVKGFSNSPQIDIHVYYCPNPPLNSYIIMLYATEAGKDWVKAVDKGTSERSHDWQEIEAAI